MQSASREPLEGEAALAVLDGAAELVVAKGKKVLRYDLKKERPADGELLELLLGRSGKLRAPAVRQGKRVLIGYNQEVMDLLV